MLSAAAAAGCWDVSCLGALIARAPTPVPSCLTSTKLPYGVCSILAVTFSPVGCTTTGYTVGCNCSCLIPGNGSNILVSITSSVLIVTWRLAHIVLKAYDAWLNNPSPCGKTPISCMCTVQQLVQPDDQAEPDVVVVPQQQVWAAATCAQPSCGRLGW